MCNNSHRHSAENNFHCKIKEYFCYSECFQIYLFWNDTKVDHIGSVWSNIEINRKIQTSKECTALASWDLNSCSTLRYFKCLWSFCLWSFVLAIIKASTKDQRHLKFLIRHCVILLYCMCSWSACCFSLGCHHGRKNIKCNPNQWQTPLILV